MTQTRQTEVATILVPLSEAALTIDEAQDIRGRKVFDNTGEEIGTIDELLVDPDERVVRFVRLKGGGVFGIGDSHWLLPVEAVAEVKDDAIHISRSQQDIAGGPAYRPEFTDQPYMEDLYGYYGYPPYWSSGYMYPSLWYGPR